MQALLGYDGARHLAEAGINRLAPRHAPQQDGLRDRQPDLLRRRQMITRSNVIG
jgi:hypothetical protein